MSASFPSIIMKAAFGRLHYKGGGAFGAYPLVMEIIMLDGNVANMRKTYANSYQIFSNSYISSISLYFPKVVPGAIYLTQFVTPVIILL